MIFNNIGFYSVFWHIFATYIIASLRMYGRRKSVRRFISQQIPIITHTVQFRGLHVVAPQELRRDRDP